MGRAPSEVRATLGIGISLILICCISAQPASAQDEKGRTSVGTGISYSTGHYGQSTTTEVYAVPIFARYETSAYALGLIVPYISVTGNGEPVPGGVIFDSTSSKRVTSSGLGDVVVMGSYTVFRGKEAAPWVDLTGYVKVGTADRKQQLGTGEDDYAAQIDLYQRKGAVNWFTSVGYKVPGSPPGLRLHSVYYASLAGAYNFSARVRAGAMWSGQEALIDGSEPQSEMSAFFGWIPHPQYLLQFYTSRGLTNGSPDWSAGVTVAKAF